MKRPRCPGWFGSRGCGKRVWGWQDSRVSSTGETYHRRCMMDRIQFVRGINIQTGGNLQKDCDHHEVATSLAVPTCLGCGRMM